MVKRRCKKHALCRPVASPDKCHYFNDIRQGALQACFAWVGMTQVGKDEFVVGSWLKILFVHYCAPVKSP